MAIVTGHKYEYEDVLVNRVKEFLDKAGWHYSFDDDMGVYEFTVRTKSMIKKINYMIDVQGNKILVLGVSPIGANPDDPKMMAELAEFICRSNWSLMNGCLEMDYRDGELRYKSFIDADHITPSVDVIGNAVHRISAMYRRYAPGILDIILAGGTAKAAMAKCGEKSPEDELRAMLAEDMGHEASGGSLDELLSRMASELGISEEEESEFDSADEVTEEIHVNPFESKGTDEEGEE